MCWKNAKPWSITTRLTLLSMLSAALILVSIGWYLHQTLVDNFYQGNRQFLIKEIQLLHTVLQEQPFNLERLADEQGEGLNLPVGRYYSRILDAVGQPLSETPDLMTALPFPPAQAMANAEGVIAKLADGRSFILMAVRETGSGHTIQIALDTSHQAALLTAYQHNLVGALLLGLLFSTLAALLVARRGLSPLTEMVLHMEGITASQLHEQLEPAELAQELSALAIAFNAMLLRLAKSFAQLNQFSADLAHELRTPINNLMGEVEVILAKPRSADEYRDILESNLEEYGRLSRIVETLLFLARAENTEIALRTSGLNGRAELEAVCSYHEALAEEKNISLICRGQAVLYADSQLFKRVLSNVLLNAVQHTPAGGEISLSVSSADNGTTVVSVADNGCGIAAAHLPHLFDRFYRVDPARSEQGTGLGLAIVKSIMDLHGGWLTVSSELGKGTVLELHFPCSPP